MNQSCLNQISQNERTETNEMKNIDYEMPETVYEKTSRKEIEGMSDEEYETQSSIAPEIRQDEYCNEKIKVCFHKGWSIKCKRV